MGFGLLQFLMIAGALGLFIYGMKVMSEGLQKLAGLRMQSVLDAMTSNRFMGVTTGLLATVIIQSSSAATVMVVSFVNAGLLRIRQAISVVMGANIGTTVKALLVSWAVFTDASITRLALPIIGLAFPLLFVKNARAKSFAEFLIGAALLFLGIEFLQTTIPTPSAEALGFLERVAGAGLLSAIAFVLVGALLATAIQSSSASVALTLVLCESGVVGYDMAAALVLGQNIGTAVTANIASLVTNVWAKRTARAHLVFNLIAVAWALLLFRPYLALLDKATIAWVGSSPFTDPSAIKWALSLLHISLNLITTLLLIQAIPLLERIVTRMVPKRSDEEEQYRLEYLEADIPLTPEVTLLEARREVVRMGRLVHDMHGMVRRLITEKDAGERDRLLARIKRYEDITDRIEVEIGRHLGRTSSEARSEKVSEQVQAILAIIGDLERIGDIFFQMSKALERKSADRLWFTPEQRGYLLEMMDLLDRAFRVMLKNMELDREEVELDEAVEAEQLINSKRDQLRRLHLRSIESGDYNVRSGLVYNDLFSSCEKVGDHIINVSEALAGEL